MNHELQPPSSRAEVPVTPDAARTPPGRRLVDGKAAAAKAGCSYRTWLRLADSGKAPYGIKLSALRRWDLDELDEWIRNGCRPVRRSRGRP